MGSLSATSKVELSMVEADDVSREAIVERGVEMTPRSRIGGAVEGSPSPDSRAPVRNNHVAMTLMATTTKVPQIKLVVFDFDLTLAAVHVYLSLTGRLAEVESASLGASVCGPRQTWVVADPGPDPRRVDR